MRKKLLFVLIFICFVLSGCKDKDNATNSNTSDITKTSMNPILDECEILSWNKVENASKYIVHINDDDYEAETNQLDCFMLLNHYGNYEITVSAVNEQEELEKSNILEYDLEIPEGLATKYNSDETEIIFGVYDPSLVKGKVIVPSNVNDKPVTTLLANAFKDCKAMTGIILPDVIDTIGNCAFKNCEKMTRCKLPKFLDTIGAGLFENCTSLVKLERFNYVESISGSAFKGCTSLMEIIIPDSIIWGRTSSALNLIQCTSLEYIEFPSNYQGELPKFGDKLVKIELNGNENIIYDEENNCYVNKDKSTLLLGDYNSTIPSYVSTIGKYAFYLRSVKNIEIPSNVKLIERFAFSSCNELENIILNEGIEELEADAFSWCESLTSIYIPSTLTKLHSSYIACASFTGVDFSSIEVSSKNPVYSSDGNCLIEKETLSIVKGNSNSVIPGYIKNIKESAFLGCKFNEIILPVGLERIEYYAFNGCENLTEVRIPKTVKYIGSYAFNTYSPQLSIYLPHEVEYVDRCIGPDYSNIYQVTDIYIDTENSPSSWNHEWCYKCLVVTTNFSYEGDIPYVDSILIDNIGRINVPYREGYECVGLSFQANRNIIDFKPKTVVGSVSGNSYLYMFTQEECLKLNKMHRGEYLYVIWKKI